MKKWSNRLIFHIFWLVISKLMRIRIQLINLNLIWIRPAYHFVLDPAPDHTFQFDADPDLQHLLNRMTTFSFGVGWTHEKMISPSYFFHEVPFCMQYFLLCCSRCWTQCAVSTVPASSYRPTTGRRQKKTLWFSLIRTSVFNFLRNFMRIGKTSVADP